jgi:chemotaxis protein methyltransferase CheR
MSLLESDPSGQELAMMIDSLTTNKTSFFRESQHFEFLERELLPAWRARGEKIRIWCAGCSSGEEPYTIGITLKEALPDINRLDVKILATDISTRVLAKARQGVYDKETLQDVPPGLVSRYFTPIGTTSSRAYRVNDSVRSLITFARLNLMDPWPMNGPFNAIFCRNVMIYFDKPTQKKLVHRYWELLEPGGHLFVGHSESLTSTTQELRYVKPAVYVK